MEGLPARCSMRAFMALSAGKAARAACSPDAPRALPADQRAYASAWLPPTGEQPSMRSR